MATKVIVARGKSPPISSISRKTVLDDDPNLLEHGEERVAQFACTGGAQVESAAAFGDAADETSLLSFSANPTTCVVRLASPVLSASATRQGSPPHGPSPSVNEEDMVCHPRRPGKSPPARSREGDWSPADWLGSRDHRAERVY